MPNVNQEINNNKDKLQTAFSAAMYPSSWEAWLAKRSFKSADDFLKQYSKSKLNTDEATLEEHTVTMVGVDGGLAYISLLKLSPSAQVLEQIDSNIKEQHLLHLVGRGDFYERRMEENMHLVRAGFTVWTFNFPGIMKSTGKYREFNDFVYCTDAVIDHLLNHCLVRSDQLLLLGNCTGSAVAVHALSGRQGIRCIYSNGISNAVAGMADVTKDMKLGVLRLIQYLLPFDYHHLALQITNRYKYDLRPDEIIGVPSPFLQIIQRQTDGVIVDGSAYNVCKRKLEEVQAGTRLDECHEDFIEQRDVLWQKSMVQAEPREYFLKDIHANNNSLFSALIPDPNAKMRVPNLPHYAPINKCTSISSGESMIDELIVGFARQSYEFLQSHPDEKGRIPFKHIHERQIPCSTWNKFIASSPIIVLLIYSLSRILPFAAEAQEQSGDFQLGYKI